MKKLFSPSFFALAALCFFLPFVSVSCNIGALAEGIRGLEEGLAGDEGTPGGLLDGDSEIRVTASGLDVVTNAQPQPQGVPDFHLPGGEEIDPLAEAGGAFPGRVFAILALAAAVVGIGLSVLRRPLGPVAALGLGVAGAVFLLMLRSSIEGELAPARALGFRVTYEYGYWLGLLLFVLAAAAGVLGLIRDRPVRATGPVLPAGDGEEDERRFEPPGEPSREPPPPRIPPPPE